ncbi:hypothetical protein NMY22_g14131 [Coprinellus aureogranulatus]|nr:hypothetical protein NMY22_g14131 [Coprinellus aureogranulatus]
MKTKTLAVRPAVGVGDRGDGTIENAWSTGAEVRATRFVVRSSRFVVRGLPVEGNRLARLSVYLYPCITLDDEGEWSIRHSNDSMSKTIQYLSSLPKSRATRQVAFPKELRPAVQFSPKTKRPPPTTVTVRVWSFWALKPPSNEGEGLLHRLLRSAFGRDNASGEGENAALRVHFNVAHCIEAVVPLNFTGSATEIMTREDVLEELAGSRASGEATVN